jgi:hypothetical protein
VDITAGLGSTAEGSTGAAATVLAAAESGRAAAGSIATEDTATVDAIGAMIIASGEGGGEVWVLAGSKLNIRRPGETAQT